MTPDPRLPDEIEPQILFLRVTNQNPFTIIDRFDGTVFEFHQNIAKDVPVDAARHIFAWYPPFTDSEGNRHEVDPVAMKLHCQRRFGWNTPAMMENGGADLFYDQLLFRPIFYRMTPILVDENDDLSSTAKGPGGRAPKVNKMMAAADAATSREK